MLTKRKNQEKYVPLVSFLNNLRNFTPCLILQGTK